MKKRFLLMLAVVLALGCHRPAGAAETTATNDSPGDLKALVTAVETKIHAGQRAETNFTEELGQFDALIARHKNETNDAAAEISYMKAMLYIEVFEDWDKGSAMIAQIKKDFPDTKYGQRADAILASIARQAAAKKVQANLAVGSTFPGFDVKDVAGQPLSVASYRGKVLLIDFWATWCGPCVGEMPNVVKTYEAHHAQGFEIIGVSLDQDRQKLQTFTEQHQISWPQFFDGQGWGNQLAVKYGIESIPANFLLDGHGKIIGQDLRGEELEAAVVKALGQP